VRAGAQGFEIVGRPDGIERLGGIDFDHAVFRHVLDALALGPDALDDVDPGTAAGLAQLREECVDAKEALSSETDVSIPVMLPERHTEVRLTRAEFEAMIRPRPGRDAGGAAPGHRLGAGGRARRPPGAAGGRVVPHPAGGPDGHGRARPADRGGRPPQGRHRPGRGADRGGRGPPDGPGPADPGDHARPWRRGRGGHAAARRAAAVRRSPAGPDPARDRRVLLAVLVAIILVAGAVGALALLSGGDDPQSSSGTTTTSTAQDRERGTTTTTEGDETPPPLPGTDWNDEARAQFVADCGRLVGDEVAGVVATDQVGPACGCAYDDLAEGGEVTFQDFNAAWSAADVPPSDPTLQTVLTAFFGCATRGG
jgi:Hsp70 protein